MVSAPFNACVYNSLQKWLRRPQVIYRHLNIEWQYMQGQRPDAFTNFFTHFAFSQCIATFNLEKLLLSQLPTSISTSLKTPTWHHHDHHYHLRAPDQLTNIPINPLNLANTGGFTIIRLLHLKPSNQTDWLKYISGLKNWIPVTKTLNKDNISRIT